MIRPLPFALTRTEVVADHRLTILYNVLVALWASAFATYVIHTDKVFRRVIVPNNPYMDLWHPHATAQNWSRTLNPKEVKQVCDANDMYRYAYSPEWVFSNFTC